MANKKLRDKIYSDYKSAADEAESLAGKRKVTQKKLKKAKPWQLIKKLMLKRKLKKSGKKLDSAYSRQTTAGQVQNIMFPKGPSAGAGYTDVKDIIKSQKKKKY